MALLDDELAEALVEFDADGAWAPNYEEQGTVMGLNGGLLGIDITDARIIDTDAVARQQQVDITYAISRFPTDHANTVRLRIKGRSGKTLVFVAVSLGGGMFEIRMLNGHALSIQGGYYELIGFARGNLTPEHMDQLKAVLPKGCILYVDEGAFHSLIQLKSATPFAEVLRSQFRQWEWLEHVAIAAPILPILSGNEQAYAFTSVPGLLEYNAGKDLSLGALGLMYERQRSGLPESVLLDKMQTLIDIIEGSIVRGLAGTQYEDRILQQQSHLIQDAESRGRIPADTCTNRLIENIAAIMESKSAMEVVVAAPTAGGCGALGGTLKAFADQYQIAQQQKVRAYFAAGMVGVFFSEGPGFSAEEGGCQLETGAAAAMTAAALVELSGGSATQAINAASMALQNTIGLVCDPVADRVEVPCLGKNISAGMNATSASVMALAGFDPVIPLDEVILTVERVAATLPASLCCTGKGGLAITPKSVELKAMLAENKARRCAC